MKISLAALLLSSALVAPAMAQDGGKVVWDGGKVVWGGGDPKASTYSAVYVPRIIEVLAENRMSGYAWGGPSAGTVENAQRVTQSPTNLAVGQWDILQSLDGKPIPGTNGQTYEFTVLAKDIGPECLYMVTSQPGYSTFGHVLGNAWDMTIATGKEGSGSLATLDILKSMYAELNDAQIAEVGSATDILQAVKTGAATHGFFVMRPDPASETFKFIQENGLTLIPVVDFDLEGTYQFLDLKVGYGGWFGLGGNDQYFTTACTSVALITGTPESVAAGNNRDLRRVEETVKRISAIDPNTLKPNLSGWRDMWDSLKVVAGSKAQDMMEASRVALEDLAKDL